MAQLPSVFKANKDSKMGFDPLPAGWYIAEIVKSEYKANAAKTGHYLTCQFKVIAPEDQKGKVVFNLLNLDNPNQQAVEIANKEFDVLCTACDVDEVEDSTELHGIPLGIRLTIDPGDANWPPKNVIKDYKAETETDLNDGPFGSDD